MILSTNVIDKANEDNDSSSESSIKDEGLEELKNIMNNNKKDNQQKNTNVYMIENNIPNNDCSNNLSKIEFKNQSINSSFKSFSRGEEFFQKDILNALNNQNLVSKYYLLNIYILYRKKMKI